MDRLSKGGGVKRPFTEEFVLIMFIFVFGFLVRFYPAATEGLYHDENIWREIVSGVSFRPGRLHLPLHGPGHPLLPVYLIKISSLLFGESRLGYRFLNVVAGSLTLVLIYLLTREGLGKKAGVLAMLLLAMNDYHINISAVAIEKSFYLFFVSVALFFFWLAVKRDNAKILIWAGVATGLAFLSKEIAGALLPVFFLYLCFSKKRAWLKRKEPYIAVLVMLIIISPDLYWNINNKIRNPYGYTNYSDHFSRVNTLGFSIYPLAFYLRGLFNILLSKRPKIWFDPATEYASMDIILGLLCLAGVILSFNKWREDFSRLMLILFSLVFGFLTLFTARKPTFYQGLDPVNWYWASISVIPATILCSAMLNRLRKNYPLFFLILFLILFSSFCLSYYAYYFGL